MDITKKTDDISAKLNDIFNKKENDISFLNDVDDSKLVVVGKDHKGNDIVVNTDPHGGLQLSPEVLEKVQNPEWIKHNREDERNRRKQLLDNWFNAKTSGPIAKDFDRKNDLFEIPKEFVHMLTNIEDEDDELDNRSKQIIKNARSQSSVVEPDLMKGLVDAIDSGAGYKNMIHVTDFLKYLKSRNVNFSLLKNDMAATKALYDEWHGLRRPSIPVIIQRLIQECDKLFFDWLETPPAQALGEDVIKILRREVSHRVEFLQDMERESGQKLYTIEDFILLKFQFQEYGLHKEDKEWFNRDKLIPSMTGVTMGHYLDEFKRRTGWDFEDIYVHYWKEVEEENKKKDQEEFTPENSLVEGKENISGTIEAETPDVVSKVLGDTVNDIYEYSDDDII
jgi:hypothetical protein